MGGAIFVELIFNRPGLGTLIYGAIQARNYPVVQGGVLIVAIALRASRTCSPTCVYRLLDPRIRAERSALMATAPHRRGHRPARSSDAHGRPTRALRAVARSRRDSPGL